MSYLQHSWHVYRIAALLTTYDVKSEIQSFYSPNLTSTLYIGRICNAAGALRPHRAVQPAIYEMRPERSGHLWSMAGALRPYAARALQLHKAGALRLHAAGTLRPHCKCGQCTDIPITVHIIPCKFWYWENEKNGFLLRELAQNKIGQMWDTVSLSVDPLRVRHQSVNNFLLHIWYP